MQGQLTKEFLFALHLLDPYVIVHITVSHWDSQFVKCFAGNYSVTGFEMILTRRMSHYMITYYLPSSLFVVVSWTSFLIPSEDIQGRMALLVTLFLVLVRD